MGQQEFVLGNYPLLPLFNIDRHIQGRSADEEERWGFHNANLHACISSANLRISDVFFFEYLLGKKL